MLTKQDLELARQALPFIARHDVLAELIDKLPKTADFSFGSLHHACQLAWLGFIPIARRISGLEHVKPKELGARVRVIASRR